jgi:hypothetical protein
VACSTSLPLQVWRGDHAPREQTGEEPCSQQSLSVSCVPPPPPASCSVSSHHSRYNCISSLIDLQFFVVRPELLCTCSANKQSAPWIIRPGVLRALCLSEIGPRPLPSIIPEHGGGSDVANCSLLARPFSADPRQRGSRLYLDTQPRLCAANRITRA